MASSNQLAAASTAGAATASSTSQQLPQIPSELACSHCKEILQCKRCSGCNNVWYCGRNCQRMDWPVHKPVCQDLQEVKRWSTFIEYLGEQFTKIDDEAYAKAPRDLGSMPMLPHLVLGTVAIGSKPGQFYLNTWRYGHELSGSIPLYIMSEDFKGIETDAGVISSSFHQLFGGQSFEETAKQTLPVAIKRSYLHDIGFKLPSVMHNRRSGAVLGRETCVFVPPRARV